MTGKRKLCIVLILLAALFASNLALEAWNQKQEEQESAQEEKEKIYLTEANGITAFSYSDGSSEMSFTKNDDLWIYDSDVEIPMDQSVISSTAESIANMTAVRKLEDPDELKDYGLDDPLYTIRYTDSDGAELVISIGNGAGENYYATVGDTGEVYTVSSDFQNWMRFDLAGLVQYDTVPSIGSGNLKKVTITQDGTDTVYKEDDDLAELAGGWGTLSLTECENYHVTEDDLAKYGLDEEKRITAKAKYKDNDSDETKEFILYVGNTDSSGDYRYVTVDDSIFVYKVSDSVIQNLMTVEETEE